MGDVTKNLKDNLLNKSNQFRFYKSENIRLNEEISKAEKGIKELQNKLQKKEEIISRLHKKIEEFDRENTIKIEGNSHVEDENNQNIKLKKLKDIRTSHKRESMKNVSIGEYTYGNPKILCYTPHDKLIIGKFCSIAKEVTILIGMEHDIECASAYPFGPFLGTQANVDGVDEKNLKYQETVIGNDVWIGYDVLILSGVKIGDGAVIGARTVVSKDVEPYSIVAGSPLKHLRYRFPEDVRNTLLEKRWWDLPDEKIEELAPYLLDHNIQNLLKML
jgi:acetyltransferase-like isoleucine patch superfamily enzyme